MSRRTRANKGWAKAARGELKRKEWKQSTSKFYRMKTNVSKSGSVYESMVPYYTVGKQKRNIHHDIVKYLNKIFSGGLFS